jgi:hypothetical protein
MRLSVVVAGLIAGLILGAGTSAPASANTIATFELENVIFNDGGTATGTFSIDMDGGTGHSSITTTAGNPADAFLGVLYIDGTSSVLLPDIHFYNFVLPIQGTGLLLSFGFTSATDLSLLPVFTSLSGNEYIFDLSGACGFSYCAQRFVTDGSIKTLSVVNVATTPVPATLPLLITALGGLGLLGWRRKRKAA